jgi:DNA-binding response OmpR family regulator
MSTHQRILLIRSDDDTHRELRVRLERHGYDVYEAYDEREGMRMAWELEPDLVIGEEAMVGGERSQSLDDVVLAIGTLLD